MERGADDKPQLTTLLLEDPLVSESIPSPSWFIAERHSAFMGQANQSGPQVRVLARH